MRRGGKTLTATYLASVAALTIGYTDAMPSPRRYVALTLAWFIMGLAANVHASAAKAVDSLSLLVLLGLFFGRAGQKGAAIRFEAFAQRIGDTFAATPSGAPAGPGQ